MLSGLVGIQLPEHRDCLARSNGVDTLVDRADRVSQGIYGRSLDKRAAD